MRNITPVNAFTDPVTTLEDGDPVSASSSDSTEQALTNRTHNLNQRLIPIEAKVAADYLKNVAGGLIGLDSNTHAVITATGGGATAFTGTGNGAGAGLAGIGGATGAGVTGQGGSTSGIGVSGTGGPGSIGVQGTGGTGNSIGVRGDGTGTGVGGYFDGQGTGTGASDDAVQLAQNLRLAGSNPVKTTGFSNRLTPLNTPKAWGRIVYDIGGSITGTSGLVDAFNVASAATQTANSVRVTFATAMADTNYTVILTNHNSSSQETITNLAVGSFDIYVYAGPGTVSAASDLVNYKVGFLVFGRQ